MTAIMLFAALAGPVASADAQVPAGRVHGRVVDAVTGRPLPDALVLLEPIEAGVLSTPRAELDQVTVLQAMTDPRGGYSFDGLASGGYLLRVQRLGYRSERVEIVLGSGTAPHLTLGLEVEPIPMEPLTVSAVSSAPSRLDPRGVSTDESSESIAELRRRRFLEPDTRLLTGGDVAAAGSFPQSDLLRAIQRFPGMSTRDTYSAEVWTRGSPWGHTRVYLDDVPLFDPFFAAGTLTGLSPSAVGGVFLHPGARPVSIGEGGAGVVRLGTRAAEEEVGLPLFAEIGLGTMQATTERRFLSGAAGVLFSARRSWFDHIWNGFVDEGFDPDGPFDYVASSSLWRFDANLGAGSRLVASRYRGGDRLTGNAAMLVTATEGQWGNAADQISLTFPLAGRSARIALGRSHYHAEAIYAPDAFVPPLDSTVVVLRPGATKIEYRVLRLELLPPSTEGLRAGIEVVRQSLESSGVTAARPTSMVGLGTNSADMQLLSSWAGYRSELLSGVDVEGGVRLDLAWTGAEGVAVRPGPHLAVRLSAGRDLYLGLAWRRSHQYMQQVGAAGTRFAGGRTFGHAWALVGDAVPALRTDIVSLGLERRLHLALWVVASVWARSMTGIASPEVGPGPAPTSPMAFAEGRNRAMGIEVQLRKLVGPFTGQVAYSWLRSTDRTGGVSYPAAADRTHSLAATVTWRIAAGLRAGASFRAYSGAPYTRVLEHPCVDELGRTDDCADDSPWQYRGRPGAERGPGFASLDVGVDWSTRKDSWGWGVSAQVRNLSWRENLGGYLRTECPAGSDAPTCVTSRGSFDHFQNLNHFRFPVTLRVWF